MSDVTLEDYNSVMDLNVRSAYFMSQALLPNLRRPGRIINISSVAGRCGFATFTIHCASKAALEGMTRALAAELGPQGHTVNAVQPGPTESEMFDRLPPELVEKQKAATPVENRPGKPEDIARVVAWLAEEQSQRISGQSISASGGLVMN